MAIPPGSVYSPVTQLDLSKPILDIFYSTQGGLFREDFQELLINLTNLIDKEAILLWPREGSVLQGSVLEPFIAFLKGMGEEKFNQVMSGDEDKLSKEERSQRQIIPFVAEALLQRNFRDKYYESAFRDLNAFQAVVENNLQ